MVLDVAIFLIFTFCLFRSFKKGFVKSFLGFFGLLVSGALAFFFRGRAADWLMTTWFGSMVTIMVEENLSHGAFGQAIINLPLPETTRANLETALINSATPIITEFIMALVSIVLVFLSIRVLVKIVEIVASQVTSMVPPVALFNHTLGLLIGAFRGYLWSYAFVIVCGIIVPFWGGMSGQVSSSQLMRFFVIGFA